MINIRQAKLYCKEPINLIENYDKAIADSTQTWVCHHRLELTSKFGKPREIEVPADVLIDLRIYCNRPASELIFMTKSEHGRMHNIIRDNSNFIEAGKRVASHPKERNGMYGKKGAAAGKHWFNNGMLETYAFECPEGFDKGRLRSTVIKYSTTRKLKKGDDQ